MARSATDLDTALRRMAGPDPIQSRGYKLDLPEFPAEGLKGLRVAVWSDDEKCPVDQEVRARVEAVADACRAAGATVDLDARPAFSAEHTHEVYQNLLHATMAARMPDENYESLKRYVEQLDPEDQSDAAKVFRAQTSSFKTWKTNDELRSHLRWQWHQFFADYDLLLTPIMPTAAFEHDQRQFGERTIRVNNEERPYFDQVFWAGLTGVSFLPSTVIPTGLNGDGLPIGIQIIGPEYGDLLTIGAAAVMEAEGFRFVPPPAYL